MKKRHLLLFMLIGFVLFFAGCATTGKNYGLGAFEYDKKPLMNGEIVVGTVEAKKNLMYTEKANPKYQGYEETQVFIEKSLSELLTELKNNAIKKYGEKAQIRNVVFTDSTLFVTGQTFYTATADVIITD